MMHYGFGDGLRSAGASYRSLRVKDTARKIIQKQKRRKNREEAGKRTA